MNESAEIQNKVLERIEHARREQSKELNLSYVFSLDEIPDEVFSLHNLETLNLYRNNIREVPERIRELTNLKHLNLSENPIEKLPDIPGLSLNWESYLRCRKTLSRENVEGILVEVEERSSKIESLNGPRLGDELALLPCLRSLSVNSFTTYGSEILKLPREIGDLLDNIGQLHLLEQFTIWGLLLEKVPIGLRNMKGLQWLGMGFAGLGEIPDWLGELTHLRFLGLPMNNLTALPDSLRNISGLERIFAPHNRFTEIPEAVFRVPSLNDLDVSSVSRNYKGSIKQIPGDILQLPNLKSLNVEGQPIEVPPPEVVKEGVEAIKNYWRQQQESGIDYLCEAKLIIVGEAGAGKTTLAKKIKDPDYELESQEPSTEGIDVIRWRFPAAVRVKQEGREELHNIDFKVNIWDFGGQEIYHATHQFFLTRRSLYALVTDDRKEDTDFNYWLQVVALLSDRSPLLIVQNEKQDRQRVIDLGSLRAHFPNLREAFRTNLATNRGLDGLEKAIRQELERLPHIGTPLPKTWSQVRKVLESDPRDYISLDEYLAVCQGHGFKRREDKLQLSGYLHDLGICLHFQDDPVLKNIVILKPKWGTDAVYNVLDDATVLDNRGRFGPSDLARIWADDKYSSMRDELLRLMMRFQLCYPLPGMDEYIAPHLLSPARPAYEWESGGLVVRYDYEFMPKGILTRFIVALNHLIADQNLVWKSGVILARNGSRAEVIEVYQRRRITVRVNGADSRGLLAIVDDQLERIHSSFAHLKYDKFLPCHCDICQERDEPFAFPLTELKDFAARGRGIQCRVSGDLVDAARLILDVLPSSVYKAPEMLNHPVIPHQKSILPPEPLLVKEVFVSYAWTEESIGIVDKLQEALTARDIVLVRDKNDVRYKDSIRDFMKRIGRGKCIVVVLSKNYLESKNCMFEMTEIAGRGDVRDRVFPIVLGDAMIYDAIGRLRYIKHWEQKKKELDAEIKEVGGENLEGIHDELDLFAKIRNTIANIVNVLGDMNALSVSQHQGTKFDSLLRSLESRLSEPGE